MGSSVLSRAVLAVLLAAALSFFGCALGTRHVTLEYPPASNQGSQRGSLAHAAVPTRQAPLITVMQFEDVRERQVIGEVLNGYGMVMADVVTNSSLGDWVANAVAYELHRRGFEVAVNTGDDMSKGVSVRGEIVEVFASAYWSYTGEVRFLARLEQDGMTLFERWYDAERTGSINVAMTAENYGRVLAEALRDVARKLAREVDQTLRDQSSAQHPGGVHTAGPNRGSLHE